MHDDFSRKLKRLQRQLTASEKILQTHPLTQEKGRILQTLIHFLHLQTQWRLAAGSHQHLILTCQAALQGQETEQSQTGFIGPSMQRIQQGLARLMQFSLRSDEQENLSLLMPFMELISLGAVYLTVHLSHEWKQRFPQTHAADAREGHHLLRELSLTFVLGSNSIEAALKGLAQGLELEEKSQNKIKDIGMCFICTLLLLLNTDRQIEENHLLNLLQHHLAPTLDTVTQGVEQAHTQQLLDDTTAALILSQLHVIRQALEEQETGIETLKQALQTILEVFELSYQHVEQDVQRLTVMCSQLNNNFNHIFNKINKNINIIQAA